MYDLKVVQTKLFAKVTSVSIMNQEAVETMYLNAADLYGEGAADSWYRRRSPSSSIGPFAPPAVLVIDGEDFNSVTDVLIKGRSASFEVVTDERIFAIVPADVEELSGDAPLLPTVFVITDSKNFANSSLMTYGFGQRVEKIDGAAKVASQIVKLLMTTPGTDDFEPRAGAGLRALPGTKIRNGADLTVPVVMAVGRVEETIKQSQSGTNNLSPSERLRAVEVIGISYNPDTPGVLGLTLKITTMSQQNVAVQMMSGAEKLLNDIIDGTIAVNNNTIGAGYTG